MCGIVGYVGSRQAAPILLDGLRRLEYRGYDSAGMAVCGPAGLQVYKTPGRLAALAELTADGAALTGTVGVGHTRWATHGEPNQVNAHPQTSRATPSAPRRTPRWWPSSSASTTTAAATYSRR